MVIPIHATPPISNLVDVKEKKKGTPAPLGIDAPWEADAYLSPRTGIKANEYFYIQEIRCQAGQTEWAALMRSAEGWEWLLGEFGMASGLR